MTEKITYGLIGEKLSHSYSEFIHKLFGRYEYRLVSLDGEQFDAFMKNKDFKGINVTIPYKVRVMEYLDHIDTTAAEIGSVNTVINKDGELYGYNTDYSGFLSLLKKNGIIVKGRKVLVLGTGGTSNMAYYAMNKLGASEVYRVSRGKEGFLSYEEATLNHSDAEIIINTTPVGMYPDMIGDTPIKLDGFTKLITVIDAVYNPLRTTIMLEGAKRKIKTVNGLYMLVSQAADACALFTSKEVNESDRSHIYRKLGNSKKNLVFVGMPGCGKTTIGTNIAKKLGREFIDTDAVIAEREGKTVKDVFTEKGEEYFRNLESEVIRELSKKTGVIIATGGGSILREENITNLKHNGVICYIDRPIDSIKPTSSRPLSSNYEDLKKRYEERKGIYESCCDFRYNPTNIMSKNLNIIEKEFLNIKL